MSCVNADNERVKRRYFEYLREAQGRSPKTVELARLALVQYDRFTSCKAYQRFSIADAMGFKRKLLDGEGKRRSELSSRSAAHSTLSQVQKFFRWLAREPGYKKAINYGDLDYLSLASRDRRIALHRGEKPSPSLEQIQHVIRTMPSSTDIELRDRALIACALLTGARVGALITLKLKHVRADRLGIDQDAREVATKFGKTFPTFFFPVGDDIRQIFLDYVDHLRLALRFADDDPLFPKPHHVVREGHMFEYVGLGRRHWSTPDPVRRIFHGAFAGAGVIYYTPHTIRRTLARLGQQLCGTPEALKAWSQNLGHEQVLTTFTSYGAVPHVRQAELIGSIATGARDHADMQRLLNLLERAEIMGKRPN
jgi:site-specific recombinase XerD